MTTNSSFINAAADSSLMLKSVVSPNMSNTSGSCSGTGRQPRNAWKEELIALKQEVIALRMKADSADTSRQNDSVERSAQLESKFRAEVDR